MNATPRMKALFTSSAALLVFGVIIPANANPEPPPWSGTGHVGRAYEKAQPRPQTDTDTNKGFTCDGNQGAGQPGHPALPHDCPTSPPPSGSTGGTSTDTGGDTGSGGTLDPIDSGAGTGVGMDSPGT